MAGTLRCGDKEGRRALKADCVLELQPGEPLEFDLASGGHWYGHGFNHEQPYPLETGRVLNEALAVNNIQCPIWMCSAGYVLFAETNARLSVRINADGNGRLRLAAGDAPVSLRVFRGGDLVEAHRELLRALGWPNRPPAPAMFGDSIFCTWTQYPRCITQDRILDMARQIRQRNYPCSVLTIDDRWESCFGELSFSAGFPDPRRMVSELHAMGFQVWLWVTPFVNREARDFPALAARKILVPARSGAGAAPLTWWGGTAGLVDLTSPDGRAWYRKQILRLVRDYGVDGFKVDGGDFKYQPAPESAAWHDFRGPSGYADLLLGLFEEIVPSRCETRTAWLSQKRSVLWREGGKDSHWGLDNGLKAMVTLALHLGLMGYDILIPDMVPGRVQTLQSDMPLPTDELMVRWTEASVLMPILQFSYFPWNYVPETEGIVRAYAGLHKRLQGYVAAQAHERAAPLLRPVWHDAPGVEALCTVSDEFMLGSDLLAAPVLDPGVARRDVLLPPGEWVNAWTGSRHSGGWVRSHAAPCPGIPLFVRARRDDLAKELREALSDLPRGSVGSGTCTASHHAGLDRDLRVTG